MYSTTNGAEPYRMVPRAMLGTLKPAPFRQWVQLERYAGKRDYVTVTTKDLAQIWGGITDRGARKALHGLEESGWVVVDDRTGIAHHSRIWIPWYPVTNEPLHEFPLDDSRSAFLAKAEQNVKVRKDWGPGASFSNPRARSMREAAMGAKETDTPYVHVPVAVLDQAASPADFLVWVAMRAHLGPEGISTSAATIGKETGVTREGVARSMKRLVSSGLLLPTGTTGRKGTKVYTVPEHLAGTYRARKPLPSVPLAAAA
jgi:hypothetical protein